MEQISNRPTQEEEAKAFCVEWGKDPYELVKGWDAAVYGRHVAVVRPRWMWYKGVSEAALRKPVP